MATSTAGDATARPNILLITCDQYRFPRFAYGAEGGFDAELKEILGFQGEIGTHNRYAEYFPGLLRLRENAVVLRNHTIAASACTPSRAVIYTGQYGTRTGVTQTDGLFKNGDSPNFPWLDADGIPTLGSWMREAGYSTHYFGKWHVSNPPEHSLKRYGFDDWEESYPEPHGAQPNNLGIYRDTGFTDSACSFLRRQGLALNYNRVSAEMAVQDPASTGPDVDSIPPWFAVVSFTNPHDIATYPGVIAQALPDHQNKRGTQSIFGPLTVPGKHQKTPAPIAGSMRIPLNPLDFPQECSRASPTQNEDLSTKPSAQHEAAYKVGLALAAKGGFNIVNGLVAAGENWLEQHDLDPTLDPEKAAARRKRLALQQSLKSCIPFQLATEDQGGPDANCVQFLQFYAWLHSVVDQHINAVLDALEQSGQADNTIVVFLTDHGEYAAAHGMMIEKWYTAYQEALHVPVVVQFPKGGRDLGQDVVAPEPAQYDGLTSHIDILPTILGLAGVSADERHAISQKLALSRPVPPLPGVDLSAIITGVATKGEIAVTPIVEPDGQEREGVLFITDDDITAPLPLSRTAQGRHSYEEFDVYLDVVDSVIHGSDGKGPVSLRRGPVKQPNHVRAVRTHEFKLVRYFDPSGHEPQEWEMYDLRGDPIEANNLVQVTVTPPTIREGLPAALQQEADKLAQLLRRLELRDL
ncbi:arylsulfatase A-like enzyme [Sphingomonas kyeonggiensis]|uniref:Arylsulfatase A-like enzyme n=1 Tax=Sphingomonas kyeonggiensis TaxID=1268553 RepID=A0A7W7K5S0_9SPHN|nr:sulfatase-like hydrolase/transferase [Sphingomonas kyeonggiensis]MBB4841168.1 arylsulfatase A-like enzyme [Sphingomonas kyeonggiensis]